MLLALTAGLLLASGPLLPLQEAPATALAPAPAIHRHPAPTELYEVAKVVDGDTLHVWRNGVKEKLRLLSVDTEEKLSGNPNASPTKPETVYGEQSAQWAVEYFPRVASVDGRTVVGLAFPGGVEQRDVYGRLLCHVLLPDGTDFNVELVRLGRSPYFNKYGESLICPEAFRAAQAEALAERRGIWDPATNAPASAGAPSARRPYDRLLPWWQARADAVEAFRERRARNPIRDVAADDPEALELSTHACAAGARVQVFGSIHRVFEEDSGDWTLLLRSGDKDRSVRVRLRAAELARFDTQDLRRRAEEEFLQNYLLFEGELVRERRGFALTPEGPDRIRLAGPEPSGA